jgi:xanthine/uracil/vitamin C permease (AzgA family)
MRQVVLVIVGCHLIFLCFGCQPGTGVGIGLFLALVGARWFAMRAISRRRSNLPIFDFSFVGAQLFRTKLPNRRETLILAAMGIVAIAILSFANTQPMPE